MNVCASHVCVHVFTCTCVFCMHGVCVYMSVHACGWPLYPKHVFTELWTVHGQLLHALPIHLLLWSKKLCILASPTSGSYDRTQSCQTSLFACTHFYLGTIEVYLCCGFSVSSLAPPKASMAPLNSSPREMLNIAVIPTWQLV